MASFSSSQIGFVTTTLTNPAPAKGPSLIGFVTKTLNNPGNGVTYGPSLIGYVTTPIGGLPVSVPGNVAAAEPGSVVSLTGSGGDSGGTPSWSQVSGPSVTLSVVGSTVTFTCPATVAGATVVVRYAVNVSYADVSVTVMPVTERYVSGGVEVPLFIADTH